MATPLIEPDLNTKSVSASALSSVTLTCLVIVVFEAIGWGIGYLTRPGEWYASLDKSSLNPPGWVFGVVWPILYAMLAVACVRLYLTADTDDRRRALILFGIQMVLNYAWSFIFFGWEADDIGFAWIILLLWMVILTVRQSMRVDRIAAYLLILYLAWLVFASYLSGCIAFMNV